jgi:hypothetical protein
MTSPKTSPQQRRPSPGAYANRGPRKMVIARQALDLPANDAALFSVRFCAVHPKFQRMPDASIFRGPLYTFVLINSCTAPHRLTSGASSTAATLVILTRALGFRVTPGYDQIGLNDCSRLFSSAANK